MPKKQVAQPTSVNFADLIDRLGKESLAAREVIREMHEAIQDAKSVLAGLETSRKFISDLINDTASRDVAMHVSNVINSITKTALENFSDEMIKRVNQRSNELKSVVKETIDSTEKVIVKILDTAISDAEMRARKF